MKREKRRGNGRRRRRRRRRKQEETEVSARLKKLERIKFKKKLVKKSREEIERKEVG